VKLYLRRTLSLPPRLEEGRMCFLPGAMSGTELVEAAQKLAPIIKVLFTAGYAREAVLHDRWLQERIPRLLKPYSHTELTRELKPLLTPKVH
jgi:hypothetical protein